MPRYELQYLTRSAASETIEADDPDAPEDLARMRLLFQDRTRISLYEDYEVRDWATKFGVSEERLRAAVAKVGNMADDVERELRA